MKQSIVVFVNNCPSKYVYFYEKKNKAFEQCLVSVLV